MSNHFVAVDVSLRGDKSAAVFYRKKTGKLEFNRVVSFDHLTAPEVQRLFTKLRLRNIKLKRKAKCLIQGNVRGLIGMGNPYRYEAYKQCLRAVLLKLEESRLTSQK